MAEFIGTFLLVLVGTSVASAVVMHGTYDAMAIGLAFGLVLTALVAGLGHISGAHLNPAVTIGLAVNGKFPLRSALAYVVAQLAGGILASLVVWAFFGDHARTGPAKFGASTPAAGVGAWHASLVEAVITFLLVFVVCAVATDERVPKPVAPIAVGFALATAVLIGVPVTGGAVNPARAFGPFVVSGTFPMLQVYLLAPLLGGIIAVITYDRFVRPAAPPGA